MHTLQCKFRIPEKEIQASNPYLLYGKSGISCLETLGNHMIFPKNHVFIKAGQQTNCCYIIKKGRILSFEPLTNGEERIYHIYERNSLFLESNLLFDRPTSMSYRADTEVEVICIDQMSLLKAVSTDQNLAYHLLESASGKYFSAMEQICHTENYSATWKICDLFLAFADYYGKDCGNGKVVIPEKFSQQTIASMLGLNRITAVRVIKSLRDMGYLEINKSQHYVVNVEQLKKYQTEKDT